MVLALPLTALGWAGGRADEEAAADAAAAAAVVDRRDRGVAAAGIAAGAVVAPVSSLLSRRRRSRDDGSMTRGQGAAGADEQRAAVTVSRDHGARQKQGERSWQTEEGARFETRQTDAGKWAACGETTIDRYRRR